MENARAGRAEPDLLQLWRGELSSYLKEKNGGKLIQTYLSEWTHS